MNYNIIDKFKIIKNNIDNNNYIESLLNNLLDYQIITKEEYNKIILKFMYLLSFTINKYNGGLMNSVKINTAININESNMYIIGLYLKNKKVEEAIDILKYNDIIDLYKISNNYIDNYINKVKFYYNMIKSNFIKNDNYFYNSTLYAGIKGFFKIYNKNYDARNKCITFDYDPFLPIFNLDGIEYLEEYIKYINYENIYCSKFKHNNIINLLNNVYLNYKDLPINIFEIVFLTSLLCKYQKINIYNLDCNLIDITKLYQDYNDNKDILINKLNQSFIELKKELKLKENEYINYSYKKILRNILFYCKSKSLNNILGRNKQKEILYYLENKMSNIKYNKLINKLNDFNGINKINYIINNINSILDLIDILNDVDFTSYELNILFSKLSLIDIMAIKKMDILRDNYILEELNKYLFTKDLDTQKIINNNYEFIKLIINE